MEREYQYYVSLWADHENGADIRLNGLGELLLSRMKSYNCSERKLHLKIGRQKSLADGTLSVLFYFESMVVFFFVICKILYGTVSLGGFYLYVNAFVQTVFNITETLRQGGVLKDSMNYYDAYPMLWGLNSREASLKHDRKAENSTGKDEIVLKNVSFQYPGSNQWILKNLNLTIQKGECIALVGRNGAGKSTLVKLLTGLYSLKDGQILIQGRDIQMLGKNELFQLFGVVNQDFRLFATTVEENIAADNVDIDRQRVRDIVAMVGLSELLEMGGLMQQVSRVLSEEGILFSGGEEQKIAIARALYKDAPIVIMDEPAASLDPIAEQEINALLKQFSKKRTTLVISHRLSTCTFCSRIIVLDDGRIVEDGTHEELLLRNGLYASMWKAQAEHYRVTEIYGKGEASKS